MTDTPLWERQPTDTPKSYEAFCIYRDMGATRSLHKAALKYYGKSSVSLGQFEKWSVDMNWQERVQAWDAYQDELRRKRNLDRQKLIEDTAYSDYEMLRDAIEKYKKDYLEVEFAGVKPGNIMNLIQMMKQADDYARRAVGLPDRITENKTDITSKGKSIIFETGMNLDDL